MKIGIASDHGGYELKSFLLEILKEEEFEVIDFGASTLNEKDDYPDYVIPLAEAIVSRNIEKGIAVCGSGVGASIAVNKVKGVRGALINDHFSAHQGVEDDDMNLICLGGRTTGNMVAKEIVLTFLAAKFSGEERHLRRLNKVQKIENS